MFTYPRLLRRVQAVLIDSILIPIAFMLTLLLVGQFEVESIYIKAAALFLPIFILEPVMVAISGGTIGHHMLGIQVQSSNSGKNLNILLALLRFVIKTFLGWLSLIFVLITKRHQAIHDLLSMSVVINKSDNLPSAEALPERSNQEDGYKYPPRFLRLFMIVLYILLFALLLGFTMNRISSPECLEYNQCNTLEDIIGLTLSILYIFGLGAIIVFGWQGKLFGCRRKINPNHQLNENMQN